jgi:chorismate synthase
MRILTAGESHGIGNLAIIEGFPKGVAINELLINKELKRRMQGAGRGKRMSIETDRVEFMAGLRRKVTLGSPIALLIKNKDVHIFPQKEDALKVLSVPRPAHADLAGSLKYQEPDMRNILERSSARETVSRVAIGSICKQFLSNFGVEIASYTVSLGDITGVKKPACLKDIRRGIKGSRLNCLDAVVEKLMLRRLRQYQKSGDSLGGVVEVWVEGVVSGLGSVMHFDKRLDAKLAGYLMSIPAVKGVEIGLGFEYARRGGASAHDVITYLKNTGFQRKTNNSGGIEGGMSTGEPIVARCAMKPIATLMNPLDSVHIKSKKKAKAPAVRSDTCAIVACGVIAESMAAIVITESFLEKFGCDSLKEITRNYFNYCKALKRS